MNDDIQFPKDAWQVQTRDLSGEIKSRIASGPSDDPLQEVLAELRRVQSELAQLREATSILHSEVLRLRTDLAARPRTLISPYTAPDSRVRLS